MNRADLYTFATARAERVINDRQIIYYGNSTVGAGLLALSAGYTTICASLSRYCTLIVVGTFNHHARGISDKVNNVIRAGACANSATDTFAGVDTSDAVNDVYCMLWAYSYAVAVTEAGEGTGTVA